MSHYFVFAGSFCPPTYGHLAIVQQAAGIFPQVTVLCSRAEDKQYWYSQEQCAKMWSAYDLPKNVMVTTYDEFTKQHVAGEDITLIRGIRGGADFDTEQKVIEYNTNKFGIRRYCYVVAEGNKADISSSAARASAKAVDLETLAKCVAPPIVNLLIETARQLKNLFLVVGQPAGGKSTFFACLGQMSDNVIWIDTDAISYSFKQMAKERFGEDLIKVAAERGQELSDFIGKQWLTALGDTIRAAKPDQHVFVECAYGLAEDKSIHRFVGNKVIYVGCDEVTQRKRVVDRGTPELEVFFDLIPGLNETRRIAQCEGLELYEVDTSKPLDQIEQTAKQFLTKLEVGR